MTLLSTWTVLKACTFTTKTEKSTLIGAPVQLYQPWSHCPKRCADAASEQMEKTAFVYGDLATHDARARLCSLLAEMSPGDLIWVLLC